MTDIKRQPMVGWYDPPQLLRTAGEVVVSTVFGRHSDPRRIEALFADRDGAPLVYDYSESDDVWIDYVADVGDGWDPTYAVAYHLGRNKLPVVDPDGGRHDTPRGRILVFGGDEVYPTANLLEYKRRTFIPYDCAFPSQGRPDVFAVPGNHDWYDSLVAFSRYFLSQEDLGGFRTPQWRSYFALKLPHRWWLLGTDVQLTSYIDGPQVEYFSRVAEAMQDGDSVIVCHAEPAWIFEKVYHDYDAAIDDRNLDYLEQVVLKGKRVRVFVAGDLHHYRRHQAGDGTQKVTAGGGGAFLHPTHGWDVETIQEGFKDRPGRVFTHQRSWPDPATSRRLCWRNLLFPVNNASFGLVPAILYTMTAWSVMADIGRLGLSEILPAIHTTVEETLQKPFAVFWVLSILIGFWLFTDTHARLYRWVAGGVHGLLHVLAVFFIGWAATYVTVSVLDLPFKSIGQLLAAGAMIGAGGWVVGSLLLGLYLLASLNGFGRHMNEAFSSLRVTGWKHFLRLHIDRHGRLTIFPIGIERVPRRWREHAGGDGARYVPDDPAATDPALIESPIVLPGPGS
ncbi:hypothetical protein [Candidatus Nitrospira bockiana]